MNADFLLLVILIVLFCIELLATMVSDGTGLIN